MSTLGKVPTTGGRLSASQQLFSPVRASNLLQNPLSAAAGKDSKLNQTRKQMKKKRDFLAGIQGAASILDAGAPI